jgi:hypothetical protein
MPISIACQSCKAKLKVPDVFAGKRINCPKCSNPLRVESNGAAAEEDRSRPTPLKPRRRDEDDSSPAEREAPSRASRRGRDADPDDDDPTIPRSRRRERDRERDRGDDDADYDERPRRRKKAKKKGWSFGWKPSSDAIIWMVIIGVGLCVGGFFLIKHLVRKSELSPFNQRIGEYTAAATTVVEAPYVKGKILPVNAGDRAVDWFYYEVPEGMRAATPAEVGTVVLLNWGEQQIGQYGTSGGGAYVRTCRVTVIDHERRVTLDQREFRGGDPPKSSRRGSSAHGDYPTQQIISYLRGLPKR